MVNSVFYKGMLMCMLFCIFCFDVVFAQSDFNKALQLITTDYPAFPKDINFREFARQSERLLRSNNYDTFLVLSRIINQFNDPHLNIIKTDQIIEQKINGKNVTTYREDEENTVGLYCNEYKQCILRLVQSSKNQIDGYILKSKDSTLKKGFHLLSGTAESPNVFYGSYIDEFSKKTRNVFFKLNTDSTFTTGVYGRWKKINSSDSFTFTEQPLTPKITFPSPEVTLVQLPCSDQKCKIILDSLLEAYTQKIGTRRTLILDIRKNVGGKSMIVEKLLPYVYSKPIVTHEFAIFCTNSGIRESEDELRSLKRQTSVDQKLVNAWSDWIKTESANIGRFILNGADTITFPEVLKYPSDVHVIVDYSNQSAAELIIMMLKQSSKVTTWGERTHGGIDYLDYRPLKLVSDKYLLYIPTSKRVIPEHGVHYDNVGIYPDKSLRIMPDSLKQFIQQ